MYVSPDTSHIDSIGSQAELEAAIKAMSYQFEVELPLPNGECRDSFERIDIAVSESVGANILQNGHFTFHHSSCSSLPNSFGGACTYDWSNAFGSPTVISSFETGHAPRVAELESYTDSFYTTGPEVLGDGIMYESDVLLTPGSEYYLFFDVRVAGNYD